MLFLHNRTLCSHKRTCPAGSIWNRAIKYETVVNCRKWDANGCVKEQSDCQLSLLFRSLSPFLLDLPVYTHPGFRDTSAVRLVWYPLCWFNNVVMRFNGSMTSGASWTVFRFLRQYHVTERDFPSGYIYGAQRYGYVETTLVWYTSVYIYVLGYISVVPHTTTTPSAIMTVTDKTRTDLSLGAKD